ncbi:MAG TPA: MOSC N-terminal beta barrel domain-containing protein [Elusimicrobiota bacterium]|nr:MOSC N-terminal beta barrel domain-containing protein [Elusimicrobiota bacterium]
MSARIAALYRHAVKSMGGTELARVDVGPAGIPGDRGWALRETATGRPASAKRFAPLMLCQARYVDEPSAGKPLPPAEVTLPDGALARTDDARANALLSRLLGAEVAFARKDDGAGHFDDLPLHFLTTATLAAMRTETGLDYDVRRFRPNVLIELTAPGRPEDAWPGASLRVGSIKVSILKPVKRCVMTTLPQPPLPQERGVLAEVLARGGALGVYGEALAAGSWSVGDPIDVLTK